MTTAFHGRNLPFNMVKVSPLKLNPKNIQEMGGFTQKNRYEEITSRQVPLTSTYYLWSILYIKIKKIIRVRKSESKQRKMKTTNTQKKEKRMPNPPELISYDKESTSLQYYGLSPRVVKINTEKNYSSSKSHFLIKQILQLDF